MQGERTDILPIAERFLTLFQQGAPDECWLWEGSPNGYGYGRLKTGGREYGAHRLAYEYATGHPIPPGMQIDHTCHNKDPDCPGGKCPHRLCVNPAHLEVVTLQENTARRDTVYRRTHCSNGHAIEGDNIYEWRGKDGYLRRACRACRAATSKRLRG